MRRRASLLFDSNGHHVTSNSSSSGLTSPLPTKKANRYRSVSNPPAYVCEDPQYTKILLLGDSQVGKTSITNQFISNKFSHSYQPTIEDSHWKTIKIENEAQTIEITDSGADYLALTLPNIIRADAFMIVFSFEDRNSFERISFYLEKLKIMKGKKLSEIPIVICGNKSEGKKKNMRVSLSEAKSFCKASSLDFFEVSALENSNIQSAYRQLICNWRTLDKENDPNSPVPLALLKFKSVSQTFRRRRSEHNISNENSQVSLSNNKNSESKDNLSISKSTSCTINLHLTSSHERNEAEKVVIRKKRSHSISTSITRDMETKMLVQENLNRLSKPCCSIACLKEVSEPAFEIPINNSSVLINATEKQSLTFRALHSEGSNITSNSSVLQLLNEKDLITNHLSHRELNAEDKPSSPEILSDEEMPVTPETCRKSKLSLKRLSALFHWKGDVPVVA
eukprot:Awhi_evm1s12955